MSLESLANELLLDLFDYLDAINLLRAFHSLNIRFNQLLLMEFQQYHLDFRSVSMGDFENFCHQYLPSIDDQVVSLHLSDDIETPKLLTIFFSIGYCINQFTHLKSLSIVYINSFELLDQITSQCRELSNLTHLSIIISNAKNLKENDRNFINNIWSLSKLTHCHLDIRYKYAAWLLTMSTISQSIRYVSVKNIYFNSLTFSHLFEHTPHLHRLSVRNISEFRDQQVQPIFPSLTSLDTMIVHCSASWLNSLTHKLPHLRSLTIELHNITFNGSEWENILSTNLKNLQVFRFKMPVQFFRAEDVEKRVDRLLDSFRSNYWIERHQWFVRCDWCSMGVNETGLVYTLPYAFDTFSYTADSQSKSTSPYELSYHVYDRVQRLQHVTSNIDLDTIENPLTIQFSSIRHLTIKMSFEDNFWSVIPTLDRLISLDVTLNKDFNYSQLQLLLNRAPRLYTLRFSHSDNFSIDTFNIHSTSVRRLDFFQIDKHDLRYFNSAECALLAQSSIVSQCQVLTIDVENRTNVLELVRTISNLRVLSVRWKKDWNHEDELIETMEKFAEWLQNHSLFKFTYSINRNSNQLLSVQLWIDKASSNT